MTEQTKNALARIFIIDDDETNLNLLEGLLQKSGYKNITTLDDPRQALNIYKSINPDIVVLDLNMPHINGFEVMRQLMETQLDDFLSILVITGDDTPESKYKALNGGAKDFINKPFDPVEVMIRISNLLEVRLLNKRIKNQNTELEEKVQHRTRQLVETEIEVIQRLARAVEYRDTETGMHVIRMSRYAQFLAKKNGLSKEICESILIASPLHDIGKIGIPDAILLKKGPLTPEEFEIMKTHTTIGGELLSHSQSKYVNMAKEIALTHHEKWNGSGYPHGLAGEDIPITGRICCLCDVFDALTSERPYKKAWSVDDAVNEIKKQKGLHFEPRLAELFLENIQMIVEIKNKNQDPGTNQSS